MLTDALQCASLGLLLVLGDSISAGVGATSSRTSYAELLCQNDRATWPDAESEDLSHLGQKKLRYINLAQPGATTRSTLAALSKWLSERTHPIVKEPVVVAITTGGNDLKNALFGAAMSGSLAHFSTITEKAADETLADLKGLLSRVRDPAAFPGGAIVALANVYDPSDGLEEVATPYGIIRIPGLASAIATYNARFKEFAAEHQVELVDAHAAFSGHGFAMAGAQDTKATQAGRVQSTWFKDPLHPNDRGHHALRQLFFEAIVKQLPRCSQAPERLNERRPYSL